jgi:tetratricopeptide (TPR) repeat protein
MMKKIIKKWLPVIITFLVIIITFILFSKSSLPSFKILTATEEISTEKINEILKMLDDDETKKDAQNKLDELYKDHTKDDTYYMTKAKIVLETDNDINAIDPLNNVKNKTVEYYQLRVRAAAGEYFTMGAVPDGLLNTARDAAKTYSNKIEFQLLAGELYYDKDNYVAASYYLDKALQIDEDNVDANYYYALCIYLLGEKEEGISYMKKAQDLYNGDDKAYKESMENYISIMEEDKR